MFKILVLTLSGVLFLSGCGGKKSKDNNSRTNRAKAQNPALPIKAAPVSTGEAKDPNKDQGKTPPIDNEAPAAPAAAPASAPAPAPTPAPVAAPAAPAVATPAAAPAVEKKPEVQVDSQTEKKVENKPEEKAEAPKGKPESHDYSGLIKLSAEETKQLFSTMLKMTSVQSIQAFISPKITDRWDTDTLDVQIEGDYKKAQYSILQKNAKVIEFKDVAFSLDIQTRVKKTDSALVGHCSGAQCEVLFTSFLAFQKGQMVENIPTLFKFVDGKYRHAEFEEEAMVEFITSISGGAGNAKAPPQMRVKHLLEQNMEKHFKQTIDSIRKRLVKDDALYSGRLFANSTSDVDSWVAEIMPDGFKFKLNFTFAEWSKREALNFAGQVPAKGARLQDKKSGIYMDIYPIVNKEFYQVVFEDNNFSTSSDGLKKYKKAIQSHVCQLMVEDNNTFSACEYIGSPMALGTNSIEGKLNGPADVGGKIVEKYTPASAEEIMKAHKEAKAKNTGE